MSDQLFSEGVQYVVAKLYLGDLYIWTGEKWYNFTKELREKSRSASASEPSSTPPSDEPHEKS